MKETTGTVTMRGNPLTLTGNSVEVGDTAPDFEVLDNDLKPVKLSSQKDKITIISSVPSLDTPVCDVQTRRFNTEAAKLGIPIRLPDTPRKTVRCRPSSSRT